MNAKILCNWLGIVDWPPDHHALLGLQPGEGDAARIEQRVQERMAKLRGYQLCHPEEATEGMNRVAQAFICLTDALSKPQRVDQGSGGPACNGPASNVPPAAESMAVMAETRQLIPKGSKTEIDWQQTPPPVRTIPDMALPQALTGAAGGKQAAAAPPARDPLLELTHSTEVRRGLGTLPAVIERINQMRKLMIAWNQAGKYLSMPGKRLARPAEEAELTRRLNKIFELTAEFPKIVGHPGQPGYRVVAMVRLEMTAQMFKMLDRTQREILARDWQAGYRVFLCHRRFLHAQFKLLRSRGPVSLVLQAVRSALNDHPVPVTLGVLLTGALCLFAIWKLF